MKYIGTDNFDHGQQPRVGILLTNLGTPEAPDKRALKVYLKEFLSDPRVVEIPRLLWWFILNIFILNIRPARSAAAYRKIWLKEGSPLMVHTRAQARATPSHMETSTHSPDVWLCEGAEEIEEGVRRGDE